MANVTIRTCDRCGKGVHSDAMRVSLGADFDGLVADNIDGSIMFSLDLCTRCTDSLRKWATEIQRRSAAKGAEP